MNDETTPPPTLEYHAPQPQPVNRLRLGLAVAFALIAVGLLFVPYQPRHVPAANRVRSGSNLRQIGQAINQYFSDYKSEYPDSFATLLMTEDVTAEMFVSPFSKDVMAAGPTTRATAAALLSGGHCSYVYLGKGLRQADVSNDTIIAYEPGTNSLNTFNVLFADGHVEWCGPIWMKTFTAKLAARSPASTQPVTLAPSSQ